MARAQVNTKARVFAACVLLLGLLFSDTARADERTDFLITRLQADDFRVRTNAALALGAIDDEAVIEPLCGALNDSSDVVRQAVAAAMKRQLKVSALPCLNARLTAESRDSVKLQLKRAIDAIAAANPGTGDPGGSDPVRPVANARFYVAISPIANRTGRPQGEIEGQVLPALQAKLDTLGGYQMAPAGETPAAASAAMSKRKLKGYYLAVSVEKFDYSDGNLRVRVKVAVFDYPGKNLRGEIPAGVTQSGVSPGDKDSENTLMGMAAARAVELFAQNFQ